MEGTLFPSQYEYSVHAQTNTRQTQGPDPQAKITFRASQRILPVLRKQS